MAPLSELGKLLVGLGALLMIVGVVLWTGLGRGWIGRMLGDISYERGNFGFYFPLGTCLLVSVLLTLVMWFFRK